MLGRWRWLIGELVGTPSEVPSTWGAEPVKPLTGGRKNWDTTAGLMCAVEQRHRYPLVCPK